MLEKLCVFIVKVIVYGYSARCGDGFDVHVVLNYKRITEVLYERLFIVRMSSS